MYISLYECILMYISLYDCILMYISLYECTCCSSHCVLCCSLLLSSSIAFLLTEASSLPISPLITVMKVSVGNKAFTLKRGGGGIMVCWLKCINSYP